MRIRILFVVFATALLAATAVADPLYHTYSIVARDPQTGDFGVAVQSHWFSVGPIVPWAESGVGAIATQSFVDPSYGSLGLALMKAGKSAPEALAGLLAADSQRDVRQVAMVDAAGRVAAHTGAKCIASAGQVVGEGKAYSVQANLMANDRVWPAMSKAYENAKGDLAERLLAALDAAQAEGGDIRGRQSAALLVVRAQPTGKPWADKIFDLRVEDHTEPLIELRRLLTLGRAYNDMNRGDELMAESKPEEALVYYARAAKLAPTIVELPFWQAVTLFAAGREAEALPIFKDVFAREPVWAGLIDSIARSGLLPSDPEKLARIKAQRKR